MMSALLSRARRIEPAFGLVAGIAIVGLLTGASYAIAQASHIPAVLLAVLLGIGTSRLAPAEAEAGIAYCARPLLRFGIVLMGVRLSVHDMATLGWPAAVIAIGAVMVTIAGGTALGRLFGLSRERALLSAGAVGICGASAALAIAGALPASRVRESETIQTIALVTCLSTVVMIAYPLAARGIGLDDLASGILFGASIHDMTQVMGAGAMISPEAATAATATKLVRIACLAPAVVAIGLILRARGARAPARASVRPPLVPCFLMGFVLLAFLVNSGLVAPQTVQALSTLASVILVAAAAALGLKTSLSHLRDDGWRPVAAMTAQTLLIGAYALGAVKLFQL